MKAIEREGKQGLLKTNKSKAGEQHNQLKSALEKRKKEEENLERKIQW